MEAAFLDYECQREVNSQQVIRDTQRQDSQLRAAIKVTTCLSTGKRLEM